MIDVLKDVTDKQDFIFHVHALFKKQTTKYSYKNWRNVDDLNGRILEVWTFVLIFGFWNFLFILRI